MAAHLPIRRPNQETIAARRTPGFRNDAGKLHLLDFVSNAAGKIRLDVHLAFVKGRSAASGYAHAPGSHLDKSVYKKGASLEYFRNQK